MSAVVGRYSHKDRMAAYGPMGSVGELIDVLSRVSQTNGAVYVEGDLSSFFVLVDENENVSLTVDDPFEDEEE